MNRRGRIPTLQSDVDLEKQARARSELIAEVEQARTQRIEAERQEATAIARAAHQLAERGKTQRDIARLLGLSPHQTRQALKSLT